MPPSIVYICVILLWVGAAPLPYGYYTLLRLVAFGIFACAAYIAHNRPNGALPWAYGFLALLFNPFVKVHFSKEIWACIDIASGLFLLATSRAVIAAPLKD